jgi:hypothetical protein
MSQQNRSTEEIPFEASTLETIDLSVYDWVDSVLNIHATTNKGFSKVNVSWSTPERAFLVKREQLTRDGEGSLVFPLISIERAGFVKSLTNKGSIFGNAIPFPDAKGGSIDISRIVKGGKSGNFINADTKRRKGVINFPSRADHEKNKIVYQTISIPIPVYLDITYHIQVKTQYQQQMNEISAPFLTYTGGINYLILKHGRHRYEGFMKEEAEAKNNIGDLGAEERVFETIFTLNVLGHIYGGDVNEKQPKLVVREGAVSVSFPKERLIFGDIPEWATGSYYGAEKIDHG